MSKYLKGVAERSVKTYLKARLEGKGLADAEAAAKAILSGEVVAVDRRWAKLAMPISQVAEEEVKNPADQKIDLVSATASSTAKALGLAWAFNAKAGVGLEIDVLDAEQSKALGINAEETRPVVSYLVAGDLGASAAGQAASVWQVGATASASLSAQLQWFIAAPADMPLGQALLNALPLMPAPMSLRDLVEAAQHPDFWGCDTRLKGTLQAGFSAKATWSATGASLTLDGGTASIGLSLGISGQASFSSSGLFRLRCVPFNHDGTYRLRVRLEQLDTKERSLGLELSLGADFSAVTKAAEAYLRSRTPELNEELLNALTNPSTLISSSIEAALTKLLGDPALQSVVPLLAGTGDKSKAVAALAKELAGPVTDKLDLLSGDLNTSQAALDALAKELGNRLFGGTPVADALAQKLKDFVDDAAGQVTQALDGGIKKVVDLLNGKAASAAEEILRPLATLGEHIGHAVQSAGANIAKAEAVNAVRTGLERYAELRRKVLKVLGDAQRAKVVLAVGIAMQESRSRQLVFEGDFGLAADMRPAERLFAALWRGDLREFSLLRLTAEASGSLSNVSGWLELSAKRTQNESVSLSAFGFEFSNASVRTADLTLRSDLSGNLLAVDGKADASSLTRNPWVQREAKLGIAVRLSDAGTPKARSAMEFAGAFSASGKDLDKKLFEELERSIASLTGRSKPIDLAQLLGVPQEFDKAFWRGASFVLPMSLNESEMVRLVEVDSAKGQQAYLRWALDAMDRTLTDTVTFPWDRPSALLKHLTEDVIGASDESAQLSYLDRYPRGYASWSTLAQNSEKYGFGTVPSSGALASSQAARQLVEFHRLSRCVRAFGNFLRACKSVRQELALSSTSTSEVVFDRCFQLLKSASDDMAIFAVASATFVGNDEPVSWRLVSFAGAVSELARGESGARFLPMLVLADRPDRPIPLIA